VLPQDPPKTSHLSIFSFLLIVSISLIKCHVELSSKQVCGLLLPQPLWSNNIILYFLGLKNLLDNSEPQVRLHAVIALGKIGGSSTIPLLQSMLSDQEPNVRWDASIALAKQKDSSGRSILLDLLDRKYLNSFPNIDEKEKVQVMLVAISVAHFIQNQELKSRLEDINSNDNNLKIREAARIALGKFII